MAFQQYDVEFTREGRVFDQDQVATVVADLESFTDLILISHGWNNNKPEADELYDKLLGNVEKLLNIRVVPGVEARRFGVVRLFWPSKKFTDEDLIPGGGAASATAANDQALEGLIRELANDPERLGQPRVDPARQVVVDQILALLPRLEQDEQARRDYVRLLRTLLDKSAAHPDDGSREFFDDDPEDLFQALDQPVVAPLAPGARGMAPSPGSGGATGLGDLFEGVKAAARRLANFTTYYQMKTRSGTVGEKGLLPVLEEIRRTRPQLKLHLAGHSFGGRLITAAAAGLPADTPALSLTLLQAAYSHNGLAERFDGRHDGAFRTLLEDRRASGPIVITHTKNDLAVGIAYPLASRLARDKASALGDRNDPYGGMGRNGAQHTPETGGLDGTLLEVGEAYEFTPGRVYNLNGDRIITGHGDVSGVQVAYALLNAIRTV